MFASGRLHAAKPKRHLVDLRLRLQEGRNCLTACWSCRETAVRQLFFDIHDSPERDGSHAQNACGSIPAKCRHASSIEQTRLAP